MFDPRFQSNAANIPAHATSPITIIVFSFAAAGTTSQIWLMSKFIIKMIFFDLNIELGVKFIRKNHLKK